MGGRGGGGKPRSAAQVRAAASAIAGASGGKSGFDLLHSLPAKAASSGSSSKPSLPKFKLVKPGKATSTIQERAAATGNEGGSAFRR